MEAHSRDEVDYMCLECMVTKLCCMFSVHGVERSPGPNFMALLTVSKEPALTETGNSVLTASVFHGLAANYACVLNVTRHYTLTRLAQKFGACA